MKFKKAVGALHGNEVKDIVFWSEENEKMVIIDPITRDLLKEESSREKFFFYKDKKILEAIKKEFQEGPFKFVVLIFE